MTPCTYFSTGCTDMDSCRKRSECEEWGRYLERHDAGSRRHYGLKERGLGMGDCGPEKSSENRQIALNDQ